MDKVPYHIGIIMDGNRRWAKKSGLLGLESHRKGAEKVREVLKWCKVRGIKILTLYAFSTENWQRNKREVNFLMRLFYSTLSGESQNFYREGIKFKVIGQKNKLPLKLQKLIKEIETLTKDNQQGVLNLAISYSGWAEMAEAVKQISKENVPPEKIDQELIRKYLWSADIPDADLIIRTSGEQRLSDFLTWEAAYAELYFCEKYWPDFSEEDLNEALEEYGRRKRRFGK